MTETWELLATMKPSLQKSWEKAKFDSPTPIQKKAIPFILDGRDIIAQAPTGTGKTLTYVLPLLHKISTENKNVQVVILAPSHELAMQIYDVIQTWKEGTEIGAGAFIGGANMKRQLDRLKKKPQIIVGTPGRILELIKQKKLKMHEVKTIVMDECDQLLVSEHVSTIKEIIKTTMKDRQIVLLSATSLENQTEASQDLVVDPVLVNVENEEGQSNVEHMYFVCEQRDKLKLFERIVKSMPLKGLAFARDIAGMNVAASKLEFEGVPNVVLHGELKKNDREQAIKKLKSGKANLLIATEVAARGLDIFQLTHVFHVDFPGNKSQYVHRSGRTGRMGAEGTVISFVTPREERTLKQYCRELGLTLSKKVFFKGEIIDERK